MYKTGITKVEGVLLALVVVFVVTTGAVATVYLTNPITIRETVTRTAAAPERTVTMTVTGAAGAAPTVTRTVDRTITQTATITAPAPAPITAQPLKIGASLTLTGFGAAVGEQLRATHEVWAEELNARGGLLGRKIQYIAIDSASDTKKNVANIERLLTVEKVDLILGECISGTVAAAAPILEQAKMPVVMCNSSERVYQQGFKYVFSTLAPARLWGTLWIDAMLAKDPTIKTIGLIAQASEFPLDMVTGMRDYAQKKGLTVVLFEQFPSDITTMIPLLQKAKSAKPDIFFGGGADAHYILMVRQMREIDFNPKAHGFNFGPYNIKTVQAAAKDGEFSFSSVSWLPYPYLPGDDTRRFTEAFTKKIGTPPNYAAASTYVAAKITEDAVIRCQCFDREKILEGIVQIGKEGTSYISYPLKWGDKTQQTQVPPFVLQIQGGKWVVIWPKEIQTGQMVHPTPEWTKR